MANALLATLTTNLSLARMVSGSPARPSIYGAGRLVLVTKLLKPRSGLQQIAWHNAHQAKQECNKEHDERSQPKPNYPLSYLQIVHI